MHRDIFPLLSSPSTPSIPRSGSLRGDGTALLEYMLVIPYTEKKKMIRQCQVSEQADEFTRAKVSSRSATVTRDDTTSSACV